MVVAIDGPAGAGKSTVARALAQRLGFTYLDTGAMYRCVALAVGRRPGDEPAAVARAAVLELGDRVRLDGEDVTQLIRTPEVTVAASRIAQDPAVRAVLVDKQRAQLGEGDWVAEGRDIGSVVAPDAEVKVFLTADPGVRARRRAQETGVDAETIAREQSERDRRDTERAHSPLGPAPDAVPVDTTGLSVDEVVAQVVVLVDEARELAG